MPNGTVYRMSFTNAEGSPVLVNIYDRLSDASAPKPYGLVINWSVPSPTNTFVQIIMSNPPAGLYRVKYDYYFPDGTFFVTFDVLATTATRNASLSHALTGWRLVITLFIADREPEVIDSNVTDPVVIGIEGSGQPVTLSVVDNDEDKFNVIRAKQAVIRFLSDENVNLNTFSLGQPYDDRYYVTIDVAGKRNFEGHLLIDDLSEAFLDPRNEVVLTASDKLASLKNVALTKDDGTNPRGKYRIIDFITWALKKTGLRLPVKVAMNLRHGSSQNYVNVVFVVATPPLMPAIIRIPKEPGNTAPVFNAGDIIVINTDRPMYNGSYIVTSVNDVPGTPGSWDIYTSANWATGARRPNTTITSGSAKHLFDNTYLDARTFEKAINESENCYTVLQNILSEHCTLTQERGAWWIVSINEREGIGYLVANFDADGLFINTNPLTTYSLSVGRNLPIWHADKASSVELHRPVKYVQEEYKYSAPKELICNIDYNRGDRQPTNDDGADSLAYALACWEIKEGTPDGLVPSTEKYFIRRHFEAGYEKQRYIVVGHTVANKYLAVMSEELPIVEGDVINPSVEVKFSGNYHPNSGFHRTNVMQIMLMGYNGNNYTLKGAISNDPTAAWVQSNAAFTTNLQYLVIEGNGNDNDTKWVGTTTISAENYPPVPVTGVIRVVLIKSISNSGLEQHFSNINLEYIPLVNGSHRKYNGHYFKANNDGNFLTNREKQYFIETTDRKIYAGAMLAKAGDTYNLIDNVYDHRNAQAPVLMKYGKALAIMGYNQYNRVFRTLRASLFGLNNGDFLPGVVNEYTHTDASPHVINKRWSLNSYEQDLKSCRWTGVFKEVFDTGIGKVTPTVEFRYNEG